MAKKLSMMTNGGANLPVANAGLKLSKIIDINKIEEHEKFKSLYTINNELLERITKNMKEKGFDQSQPVHIWITTDDSGTEHFYLIDGYTRLTALRNAGFTTVPYFEHRFETFEDAYRYVLHLQIDRRNLSGQEFMQNLEILMGSDYVKNYEGNKAELIAKELDVSQRTVERALSVENNATEEQKARIASGEATINEIYKENHSPGEKEKLNRHVSVQEEDDICDSLSDNSGIPSSLNFNHSDGIERPKPKTGDDTVFVTLEEKNLQVKTAYEEGLKKGSELAYEIYEYILSEIENGKSTDNLRNDEKFEDFSIWEIYKAFGKA